MNSPLISIIIPTDHSAQYLETALKSVNEQTFKNLELIFIDNQSSDTTIAIIQAFIETTKFSCTLIQENFHSTAQAIQKGLSRAKGTYLTFLPPQDYFPPTRMHRLIEKATRDDVHFIFTRVDLLEASGKRCSFDTTLKTSYEKELFDVINMPSVEFSFFSSNLALTYGNMFFSKKLYDTVAHYKDYKYHDCLGFIIEALKYYPLCFLNENLYNFRLINPPLSTEEQILSQKELDGIYHDYFVSVHRTPPSNPNAPSKDFFIDFFLLIRHRLNFDRSLASYIDTPSISPREPMDVNLNASSPTLPKKNSKISLITHNLETGGGGPKLVLDLSQCLKEQGYQVSVFSVVDGPLKKEFINLDIPLHIFPKYCLKWTENNSRMSRFSSLLLATIYINLKTASNIIVNSAASYSAALPLALFSINKRVQWYIHESFAPTIYLKTGLSKKLLKLIQKRNNFSFWFGSESTKNIWNSILDIPGKVLYWSGLKKELKPTSSNKPIKNILAIGYSSPRKGFHFLVDAFINCLKKKAIPDDVTLTLIGFAQPLGGYNQDIILKILGENLQDRIKIVSCIEIEEVKEFFEKADLFIQPSILECLPLSLLQAMSLGIPVITTDVNGCKEAISHHFSGYLCNSSSTASLEKALTEAIQNPIQTRQYAANAQNVFNEKFSIETTLSKIVDQLHVDEEKIEIKA